MSIRSEKRLRQGQRRTLLSGRWIDVDQQPLATWLDIVQPQPKTPPRPEERYHWPSIAQPEPEIFYPFSGRNRHERRARLRGTGLLGAYTAQQREKAGLAWTENIEARRAMRRNAKAAALQQRLGGNHAGS